MTKVFTVYSRLYAECFRKAFAAIAKSPWTLLLPILLSEALTFIGMLVAPLGIVGGFIMGLISAAALSSYLYFVSELVSNVKVTLGEFQKSFAAYFWSVMGFLFVLFIAQILLRFGLGGMPNSSVLITGIALIAAVILNAVPEVLYVRNTRTGTDTVGSAMRFMQTNWIEWFIPNLPLLFLIFFVVPMAVRSVIPADIVHRLIEAMLIHVLMVFRGHLFLALDRSSHRQRMFRYRNADVG